MTFWNFADQHPYLIGFLAVCGTFAVEAIAVSIANAVRRRE